MSITVYTGIPAQLLNSIKKAIDDRAVQTWEYDKDGDFIHSPEQWSGKAWLRPKTFPDRIVFNILKPRGVVMSRTVYAVYHGRFIEMLLTHFDEKFDRAVASALPTSGDILNDP